MPPFVQACTYWFYACSAYIMSRYNLDPEGIALYAVLIVADMVFWISKAYVIFWEDPKRFSLRKLVVWFVTKCVFLAVFCLCLIIISYISEQGADIIGTPGMWLILAAQLIGVIHNARQIHAKKELAEWDVMTFLYDSLIKSLKWFVEKWAKGV